MKALTCLYIAVDESVANDVNAKVLPCLKELESLRHRIASVEEERDILKGISDEYKRRIGKLEKDLQNAQHELGAIDMALNREWGPKDKRSGDLLDDLEVFIDHHKAKEQELSTLRQSHGELVEAAKLGFRTWSGPSIPTCFLELAKLLDKANAQSLPTDNTCEASGNESTSPTVQGNSSLAPGASQRNGQDTAMQPNKPSV